MVKVSSEVPTIVQKGAQVQSDMMEIEQNNDSNKSRENNSCQINKSDNVIIREEEPENSTGYIDRTNYDVFNVRREGYFFADEIKVDGETIFTIPFENQLDSEGEKPKRKSRWGDRPQRRKKAQVNLMFNPLQGFTTGNGMLQITADGFKQGHQYPLGKEEEEEKISRWGPEYEKTFHPPLLNFIPHTINDDELEYLLRLYRMDEIQNKVINKTKSIIDDEDCRSPSPSPIYNETGKRINTREFREDESLQKEKYNLIEEALRINPTFIPPLEFRIQKKQKKIYLPEHNSELLKQKIIGLKGATHKKLEQDSNCKISIKGKGSGNGMKRVENDVNDKLHILIQATTEEELEKGTKLVDEILRGEEKSDENMSGHNQVAIISDYLNQDFCSKCHQTGHRSWECANKASFNKVELKCEICGDKGHVTFDCKFKKEYMLRQQQLRERGQEGNVHQQFEQFISEVEGDKRLLNGRPNEYSYKTAITATNFITDAVVVDHNMLMLQNGGRLYDNSQENTHTYVDYNRPKEIRNPYQTGTMGGIERNGQNPLPAQRNQNTNSYAPTQDTSTAGHMNNNGMGAYQNPGSAPPAGAYYGGYPYYPQQGYYGSAPYLMTQMFPYGIQTMFHPPPFSGQPPANHHQQQPPQ